jgi:hypothetical protein
MGLSQRNSIPEVRVSQRHDLYDMPESAYASPRAWIIRVDLDEVGERVRARASLAGDGHHVEGEGLSSSDLIGTDQASCLAVGEALLEVAGSLIGELLIADHPETHERRAS